MNEALTISALRRAARVTLTAASLTVDEAAIDTDVLLAHALKRTRSWLFAHADEYPTEADAQEARRLLLARAAGVPVAQLTGRRGFWTFELAVDESTLIPRPETELLVELALARLPIDSAARVADLGTGTGAIAIALALERPQARIFASDIDEETLKIATSNAAALGAGSVEFRYGSWCEALSGLGKLTMIVSNPPYIEDDDPHLLRGDLRFEPRRALASGADGLDAIRTIISDAPQHLADDGWLLLEHGLMQGAAVRDLLSTAGFAEVSTSLDLAQRERVTQGQWMSARLV